MYPQMCCTMIYFSHFPISYLCCLYHAPSHIIYPFIVHTYTHIVILLNIRWNVNLIFVKEKLQHQSKRATHSKNIALSLSASKKLIPDVLNEKKIELHRASVDKYNYIASRTPHIIHYIAPTSTHTISVKNVVTDAATIHQRIEAFKLVVTVVSMFHCPPPPCTSHLITITRTRAVSFNLIEMMNSKMKTEKKHTSYLSYL